MYRFSPRSPSYRKLLFLGGLVVNCFRSDSVFWPAAVRPWTSACVWMLWWMFHRTSVLVTGLRRKSEFQINVLSCNMLTVHVLMNCPCTQSSASVSFLSFFCIFSCVLLFYFLVFLVCTVSTQEHFNFLKSKGLVMYYSETYNQYSLKWSPD